MARPPRESIQEMRSYLARRGKEISWLPLPLHFPLLGEEDQEARLSMVGRKQEVGGRRPGRCSCWSSLYREATGSWWWGRRHLISGRSKDY